MLHKKYLYEFFLCSFTSIISIFVYYTIFILDQISTTTDTIIFLFLPITFGSQLGLLISKLFIIKVKLNFSYLAISIIFQIVALVICLYLLDNGIRLDPHIIQLIIGLTGYITFNLFTVFNHKL